MINVAVVGLGKMGISHLATFRAHPDVNLVGVCDTSKYSLDLLGKYTGLSTFSDFDEMLRWLEVDAVVIATPSHLHARMVRAALDRGLHVFCEKPFCLDPDESDELAALAQARGLVTQVGYHNRFVAAFAEVKSLLEQGSIGRVSHVLAEAYGPVVLKPSGSTWRTRKVDGGGCLYDYAAHPVDLLTWYFGVPELASGSVLRSVFSRETDDEIFSTLRFRDDLTSQLSVSWSDESQRKMSTKITLWGSHGRIIADRQEIQVFLREGAQLPPGYHVGWNVKYTTDLTDPVWFYLRGEEYSAQVDSFVARVTMGDFSGSGSFSDAAVTDRSLAMIVADAAGERAVGGRSVPTTTEPVRVSAQRIIERARERIRARSASLITRKASA